MNRLLPNVTVVSTLLERDFSAADNATTPDITRKVTRPTRFSLVADAADRANTAFRKLPNADNNTVPYLGSSILIITDYQTGVINSVQCCL